MNSGNFLYAVVLELCAGVVFGFLFNLGIWSALFCIFAAALLLAVRKPKMLLAAACLAAAALGIIRVDFYLWNESQETISKYFDGQAVIEGVVSNDPDRRETSLHLTVTAVSINGIAAKGMVLAQVARDENVSYGDQVKVRGLLEAPQTFETNGGREFNYPGYLRVQGISGVISHATLLQKEEGSFSLYRSLFSLKHAFENSVEKVFAEPQGSLLEGLLLGERRGLPQELTDAFISSSLIHVVVLSGTNISIISEAIMRTLSFFPNTLGFSLGGVSIILFAMMTGGGATAIRAVIMGLIAILARYLHRPNLALRALALAAAALIVWKPISILYDTSFILSFLATFGLITLSPYVEKQLTRFALLRHPKLQGIRSIAASTISVQVFILPALLYFTGVLSFLALPANIVALPTVPFSMLFGFIAGMLGFVSPMLALIPAVIGSGLLWWLMFVAQTTASVPLGSVIVPAFPAWVAIIAYLPLFAGAIWVYKNSKIKNQN